MEKIRVWLYCRVACRDEADLAMKRQEDKLRQAIDAEMHEIVGITREYGPGRDTNRLPLQKLLEEAGNGGMDQLWVIRPDRISRDYPQMQEWVDTIVGCGVAVCMRDGDARMHNVPPPDPVRAALYMRFSTEEQLSRFYETERNADAMCEQEQEAGGLKL